MSSSLGRRRFLKQAAIASAPLVIPASVLGAAGRASPSNRIVMGCIGVGGQGTQGMAGGIWAPEGGFVGRNDTQVVAVCDVNGERRENARNIVNERYGNKDCAAYNDFRELLARDDIDAVLIATGDRWHPYISLAAARAGKDMYCEKPVSLTIEEAKVMAEVIPRYGRVFQAGTQQRSSHAFRFACELVRNGYIGEVREVVIDVAGPASNRYCSLPAEPVPEFLDYNMWLGPIPYRPYNPGFVYGWMGYRDCSGGEMTNWGAHHFDIAQWGLGMDSSGPVEVIPPNGRDVHTLTYRYANGVVMTRDPERMRRESGFGNGVLFVGTEGKVAVWRYDLKTWPAHLKGQKIGPNEIHLVESDNHHDNFINAIRSGGRTIVPIETAARSMTVCHLGNIAYETGTPVRWDPERQTIVDNPQAERLMSRPARSPWHL
jgi:predicted dehydrogenase